MEVAKYDAPGAATTRSRKKMLNRKHHQEHVFSSHRKTNSRKATPLSHDFSNFIHR